MLTLFYWLVAFPSMHGRCLAYDCLAFGIVFFML